MKVLFAVSNENISTQIVKRYQKEYKEIISYKNMYYFNAIVKELQRDKSYDRIVISEDLEPFANNNYDEIEKFLFEKLDNISDEATGTNGEDIPIILLASDKRAKADPILVKLFGIGIYNVLLAQDKSTQNVCSLLNKPRSKKEAKIYYKIESEDVNYKSESEENVSEAEIKNILNHYRKLGKDEDRYIESFNNIAAQYNDAQLRIITKFLPLNVKAVLEEQSPKYQSVMTFGEQASAADLMKKKEEEEGLQVGFLNYTNTNKPVNPVIVPTAVKKVAMKRAINEANKIVEPKVEEIKKVEPAQTLLDFEEIEDEKEDDTLAGFEDILDIEENEVVQPVKRGRGRPRKVTAQTKTEEVNIVKRGRGRPKKIVEKTEKEDDVLPGFDDVEEKEDAILPGFDDIEEKEDAILPGFDDIEEKEDDILPGFDDIKEDEMLPGFDVPSPIQNEYYPNKDTSALLSKDKKVVSFVGTTKNGTSFIINNLAKCLSSRGIKTAILDLTTNKNSYYIYTKNEESLRKIAYESIRKLEEGTTSGISVDKNLDVYTSLPGEKISLDNIDNILSTLIKNYSIILIDCDFNTPSRCFEIAQEIYVVQTMDIFTIQPMTAFLRDLKAKNILEQEKLRIIINKEMKIRGLTPKVIIGGLSKYNDPSMSFMTDLFDVNLIKYSIIPFEEKVCSKYLEGVMNCEVSIDGYTKSFNAKLKELANMVYPLVGNKKGYQEDYSSGTKFSTNMNNTLEQMRKKY